MPRVLIADGTDRMTQFQQDDTSQDWGQKGFRMLLAAACLFIVLAGMKAAAGILVPIACAFFLAVLSYPLLLWLTRHRVPHPIAMGATVAINIGVLAGMITAAVQLIISFQRDFREVYVDKLRLQVNAAGAWLEQQGVEGAKASAETLFDWNTLTDYIGNQDVIATVGSALGSTFGTLAAIFISVVMVIILQIFILMEAQGTHGRITAVKLAGGPDFSYFIHSASDVQKYLGIKTAISALTGILAGGWCWALGPELSDALGHPRLRLQFHPRRRLDRRVHSRHHRGARHGRRRQRRHAGRRLRRDQFLPR